MACTPLSRHRGRSSWYRQHRPYAVPRRTRDSAILLSARRDLYMVLNLGVKNGSLGEARGARIANRRRHVRTALSGATHASVRLSGRRSCLPLALVLGLRRWRAATVSRIQVGRILPIQPHDTRQLSSVVRSVEFMHVIGFELDAGRRPRRHLRLCHTLLFSSFFAH